MKHIEQSTGLFSYQALTKNDKTLMAILVVIAIASSVVAFFTTSTSIAITYLMAILLSCVFCLYSVWSYKHVFPARFGKKPIAVFLLAAAASLVFGVIGEIGTLIGSPISSPLNLESWNFARLALLSFGSFFCVTALLYSTSKAHNSDNGYQGNPIIIRYGLASLTLIVIGAVAISAMITGVYRWRDNASLERLLFLLLCLTIGGLLLIRLRNEISRHLEYAFLIIALIFGLFLSISMPQITGVSWDDQIHFDRSLGLSYLGHSEIGEEERLLATQPTILSRAPEAGIELLEEAREQTEADQGIAIVDGLFAPGSVQSLLSVSTIAYVPSAIGLWLGRLFHLPTFLLVVLGRSANLLCYVLIMAIAVRVIPYKKTLLCAIALFPTNIFLAANYSYDTWITAFIALGIALFLRERASENDALSLESFLTMLLILTIGILPKAVYFPILGILFLMPKEKLSNYFDKRCYNATVIISGLLIVATFVLPILFSPSTNVGDVRGGEGINSTEQISFILTNPLTYCEILLRFLLSYLAPISSDGYILSYAYLGTLDSAFTWISTIPFLILVVVAVLDNDGDGISSIGFNKIEVLWILLISFVSIALAATSLYVSFTPVGLETINGCQPRYIIPIILPALLTIRLSFVRKSTTILPAFCLTAMAFFSILCDLVLVVY